MARTEAIFPNSTNLFQPGQSADFKLLITDNLTNTGAIPIWGKPIGRIRNQTAVNVVLSFLDADAIDSTGLTGKDEFNSPLTGFELDAGVSRQLPTGLNGMKWCIPLITSGSTGLTLHFHLER